MSGVATERAREGRQVLHGLSIPTPFEICVRERLGRARDGRLIFDGSFQKPIEICLAERLGVRAIATTTATAAPVTVSWPATVSKGHAPVTGKLKA